MYETGIINWSMDLPVFFFFCLLVCLIGLSLLLSAIESQIIWIFTSLKTVSITHGPKLEAPHFVVSRLCLALLKAFMVFLYALFEIVSSFSNICLTHPTHKIYHSLLSILTITRLILFLWSSHYLAIWFLC